MNNDYAACGNKTCRLRLKCYRYMMKRGEYQTYAAFGLMKTGLSEICEGYSALRPGDVLREDAT